MVEHYLLVLLAYRIRDVLTSQCQLDLVKNYDSTNKPFNQVQLNLPVSQKQTQGGVFLVLKPKIQTFMANQSQQPELKHTIICHPSI